MFSYNPDHAPDSDAWNALDEAEQILAVITYHEHEGIPLPNLNVHAVIHVAVENQLLMGDKMNTAKTLERLMADGLDRHDAIHAIGTVISSHLYGMMKGDSTGFSHSEFGADLDALTVEKWKKMG